MAKRVTIQELTGCTPQEANFVIEYTIDFDVRRASRASGWAAESGRKIRDKPNVMAAIQAILLNRMDAASINAEWVLLAAYDNYRVAHANKNVTAANTALTIIAKHSAVDAFAAEKLTLVDDRDIKAKLDRGRDRVAALARGEDGPVDTPELDDLVVSFMS